MFSTFHKYSPAAIQEWLGRLQEYISSTLLKIIFLEKGKNLK
jgi:hypothetical protein